MSDAERDPHVLISSRIGSSNKMLRLPSHRARWGWIVILGAAKLNRPPGRFDSLAQLRNLAGEFRDCVPAYLDAGLLETGPTICQRDRDALPGVEFIDEIVVHDWRRHQERGTSRTTEWRNRPRSNETANETPNETAVKHSPPRERAAPAVAVALAVKETTEGVQGEPDPFETFRARTGHIPTGKIADWLNDLSGKFGDTAVSAAIAAEPLNGRIPPAYLQAVTDALTINARRAERAERTDEVARNAAKRRPISLEQREANYREQQALQAEILRGGAA